MDDGIKRLLDISDKAKELGKKNDIKTKAGEKDSLNDYLSEREQGFVGSNCREKLLDTKANTTFQKNTVYFSIKDYHDMLMHGCNSSVEDCVNNIYFDEDTIVYCIDNKTNYTYQEKSALIEFIISYTNKK